MDLARNGKAWYTVPEHRYSLRGTEQKEGSTMKKRMTIVALLLAMLTLLTACGANIEGTWKLTGLRSNNATQEELVIMQELVDSGAMDRVFTFKGGRFTQKVTYRDSADAEPVVDEYDGKYRIDGNQLVFISDGADATGITMEFKVNGNTLELISGDGVMILTKQN